VLKRDVKLQPTIIAQFLMLLIPDDQPAVSKH